MVVYCVYILEVITKNGKIEFYTGYTNNLLRRWKEHRNGTGAKFCRGKGIELKYYEYFPNRKEAMKREIQIKSFTKQKKRQLIESINNNSKKLY